MKTSRQDRDRSRQIEMRIATDRDSTLQKIATDDVVVRDSQSQKNRRHPLPLLRRGGARPDAIGGLLA